MAGVYDDYGQSTSVIDKYGQPVTADLWLSIIDGGNNWRQDTMTGWDENYRYHKTVNPVPLTEVSAVGSTVTITWNQHDLSTGDQIEIKDVREFLQREAFIHLMRI